MNGVLVVDKPVGPTSHDVVARVRKATGIRRVGHTGTLDPMASGVLPLVLGRATRLARFLTAADKIYDAHIRLGRSTATFDATGADHPSGPRGPVDAIGEEDVERALAGFQGTFLQTPPPFSAKKIGGVRAYALARRRRPATPPPVEVTVRELTLVSFAAGEVRLRLTCSAGFYVRSLAHDLGARLGCGAHLEALRREQSGGFNLDVAVPLDALERDSQGALDLVIPLKALLPEIPAVVLTETGVQRAVHGNAVMPGQTVAPLPPGLAGRPDARERLWVRLLDREGALVALAEVGPGGVLHPTIVLV